METITDRKGVKIKVGQECEAYNNETNLYFKGDVVSISDDYIGVEGIEGDTYAIEPYDIEIELDLRDIAEQGGFDVIETTTGSNGYPQNLKFAIVGFDNFKQAQELADKYSLKIQSFERKDGWSLWTRDNNRVYESYKNSAEDFGDNYDEFSKMEESEFIEKEFSSSIDDIEDFESLEDLLEKKKEIWKEVEYMEDDEIVITCYGEYYETIKKESMSFSHDTWNYKIGLI